MVRSVAGNLPEQVKNNQSVNTAAGNGGQKMSQYSWFTVYIHSNQMSRIENGRANCTVPQLYVISQILGCSVDYLLFGKQRLTISQEQADSIKGLIETFTK